MSERVVVEKTKADMIVEAISKSSALLIVFCFLVLVFSVLLWHGKITQDFFEKALLSGAITTALLKLVKE